MCTSTFDLLLSAACPDGRMSRLVLASITVRLSHVLQEGKSCGRQPAVNAANIRTSAVSVRDQANRHTDTRTPSQITHIVPEALRLDAIQTDKVRISGLGMASALQLTFAEPAVLTSISPSLRYRPALCVFRPAAVAECLDLDELMASMSGFRPSSATAESIRLPRLRTSLGLFILASHTFIRTNERNTRRRSAMTLGHPRQSSLVFEGEGDHNHNATVPTTIGDRYLWWLRSIQRFAKTQCGQGR